MRYGVQFMIADEVLEDAGNRDLITAAFGDASGRGSELSAAEQVALLHSLVINPTRPSTQIDTATESGELPDLTRLIADMVRFSDPDTLRRAARTLHGHADHRQQRYDGSGKPYVRIQSDPVPLEPETEPRRGRRIELPLRAGTLSGESAD